MLIVIGIFLAGVLFTVIAVWLLYRRRLLLSSINGTAGISFVSLSIILALISINIHTYHQLTSELKVAQVKIGTTDQQGIPVTIQTDDIQKVFYINAEEWQLNARFLKWKSWAYLLGTEPVVRLESLVGRMSLNNNPAPKSYYFPRQYPVLSDWGSTLSEWFGIVDTYYGSAVYMPAVEGSVFSVSATISGLIARPENETAREAVLQWMNQ